MNFMEKITKEDQNKLFDILKVSRALDTIYNNLLEAELSNDEAEYKKNIDYLNIALETEHKLYKRIDRKGNIYLAMCGIIRNDMMQEGFPSNLEAIISGKTQDRANRRVLTKLTNILVNITPTSNKLMDYIDCSRIMEKGSLEHMTNSEKIIFPIEDNFEMKLVEDFNKIDLSEDDYKKRRFLKLKYDLSFLNSEIEKENIKNNFNSTNFNFTDKQMKIIEKKYDIEDEDEQAISEKYIINILTMQIDLLKKTNNKELDKDKILEFLIRTLVVLKCINELPPLVHEFLTYMLNEDIEDITNNPELSQVKKIIEYIKVTLENIDNSSVKSK